MELVKFIFRIFIIPLFFILADPSLLNAKENVILYPEYVSYNPNLKVLELEVHAHVFELKQDSEKRKLFIKSLEKKIGLSEKQIDNKIFKDRIKWFLIDNHRWKKLQIKVGEREYNLEKTHSNGHSLTKIKFNMSDIKEEYIQQGYIPITHKNSNSISGKIYLIKEKDLCLISDIDDTIKISDVRNKQKLMENSFLFPFQSVTGMEKKYSELKKTHNAFFFYVSASPWQLFTILSEFFLSESFPEGIYRMKQFRIKDSDFFNLFTSPQEYKYNTIETIFKKLPNNQFILVGDSGEKDPEAYAALARRYPTQVKKILIRRAYKEDQENRFDGVFDGIDKVKWLIFDKPEDWYGLH